MAGAWYAAVRDRLGRGKTGSRGASAPSDRSFPAFDLDHDHGRSPRELIELLGAKGAGLAEMRQVLRLPVPPGFVLGAPLCRQYFEIGWPVGLDAAIDVRLCALEKATNRRLNDPRRPLLLAVRSGAAVSMPGMTDTVLNIGVNAGTSQGLAELSGDERFPLDVWLRFCRSYAAHVLGLATEVVGPPPPRDADA
jgi:pyruvate, orthophosphate dikinase